MYEHLSDEQLLALTALGRFEPSEGPAVAWLLGIARHKLLRSYDEGLERVDRLGERPAEELLAYLPAHRLLPAVALVAAVLVALVLLPSSTPDEEVAATPTPTPNAAVVGQPPGTDTMADALGAVAGVYGAFRRPPRAADTARGLEEHINRGLTRSSIEVDAANARRLATYEQYALYAVPALRNGRATLCTYVTRRSRPASLGCGPFDPAQAHTRPGWSKTFYRPAPLIPADDRAWSIGA